MSTDRSVATVEFAGSTDLQRVLELDDACFPSGDSERESAVTGEIEQGVAEGEVLVARLPGSAEIVGFLHFHRLDGETTSVFLNGIGVDAPARTRGIGTSLLLALLQHLEVDECNIEATVAPTNTPMLRLLLQHGFVGTEHISDYFGVGRHRVYLRRGLASPDIDHTTRLFVPSGNVEVIEQLMRDGRLLTGFTTLPHGDHFELTGRDLTATDTRINESAVSVSFAGILFAATAFLAGFSIASDNVATALLATLVVSLVAQAAALIIYTNATGELARLHRGNFDRYMESGNLLSEFGGVYPFFHTIPIVVASLRRTGDVIGLITCVGATIALAYYNASRFNILGRYLKRKRLLYAIARTYLTISPVFGFLLYRVFDSVEPWVGTNAVALFALTVYSGITYDEA